MKCPVCEFAAPKKARFCPRCGGVLDPFLHSLVVKGPEGALPEGGGETALDSVQTASFNRDGELDVVGGRYRLRRIVGRGGFGEVYEAEDLSAGGRAVALKKLLPSRLLETSARFRFKEEARALARLRFPGIVRFLDWGFHEDAPYLVTAFLRGRTLRDWVLERKTRKGPRESEVLGETLDLAFQLLDALAHAHASTAHMDLKPENIFLLDDGTAVILDFGLARIADFRAQGRRLLGTAYYVAPEVVSGGEVVGYRADVFSLGVILYEMLRGELPVGVLARPSEFLDGADGNLDEVVRRALETDPVRRFRNVFTMRASLCIAAPGVRPIEEEIALARRALAGLDPTAPLRLAASLEAAGETEEAQEMYKRAAAHGRGTPVEEMARESLGYPRRKTLRFCILCGVDLPPGSRRTSLCRDCRRGHKKKRAPVLLSGSRPEKAMVRGPRGGASLLRFSRKGGECLAVGEFGELVVVMRKTEWEAAHRFKGPRGVIDADFLGGTGMSILLAGREGVHTAGFQKPVTPVPIGVARPKRGPATPDEMERKERDAKRETLLPGRETFPTACAFFGPGRALVGDTEGRLLDVGLGTAGHPLVRPPFMGRVLILKALPGGERLALDQGGEWRIWTPGQPEQTRSGSLGCGPVALSAAHGQGFVAVSCGGEILLADLEGGGSASFRGIPDLRALAVDPNGAWIAAGDGSGVVHVLRPGGEAGRRYPLDGQLVLSVEASPDGSWLASSTLGGGVFFLPVEA